MLDVVALMKAKDATPAAGPPAQHHQRLMLPELLNQLASQRKKATPRLTIELGHGGHCSGLPARSLWYRAQSQ